MSTVETVHVNLAERSYDVLVGGGILHSIGEQLKKHFQPGSKGVVVTDSTVGPLYADRVLASLKSTGFNAGLITVPAGETSKCLAQVGDISRQMIRAQLDRGSFLIALGGGVVGDLAGFAASIFYRGIPYVQIPTTIVSQVDSSVGGKTGVNTPEGKNLIGAFHHPEFVLADTETLTSLPEREYLEGFAEIIKHAAIRDREMLPLTLAAKSDREHLAPLIARNVQIKASIVEEDERETSGTRALLNFGHTIGHGIEAAVDYGTLLHGEAISLGTRAALTLSVRLAGLAKGAADQVAGALDHFGLPRHLSPNITTETVMERLTADKKFRSGQVRFVLLRSLGDAFVSDNVTPGQIRAAVESLREP